MTPERWSLLRREQRRRSRAEREKAKMLCCGGSAKQVKAEARTAARAAARKESEVRDAQAPAERVGSSMGLVAVEDKKKDGMLKRLSKRISKRLSSTGSSAVPGVAEPGSAVDVIIVGGGFSGAYCAYQLRKTHPHLRVVVLERDVAVGGRLQSDDNDEDNDTNKDELGGMRLFPSVQPRVAEIVREVGCSLSPMRLADGDNLFFFEGERMRKKEFKLDSGMTPTELVQLCLDQYARRKPEDAALPHYECAEMRELSLPEFMLKYGATQRDLDQFFMYSGYDIFTDTSVAASVFFEEGKLYGPALDKDQHYVKDGFEMVVRRMIEKSLAEVKLGCAATAIAEPDADGLSEVTYRSFDTSRIRHGVPAGSGEQFTLRAKRVIVALPQDAAAKLARRTPVLAGERLELINSAVTLIPLFKCFLEWDRVPGQEQWWKKLQYFHGKSTTDLEIRQCHYYDNEDILAYCSGRYAEYWDREFRANWRHAAREMFDQIKLLHGPEANDIPEPDWDSTIFRFWPNGSHKWCKGVDVAHAMHTICHGGVSDSPVLLVGDAFSGFQGWTQGCIETGDIALEHVYNAFA